MDSESWIIKVTRTQIKLWWETQVWDAGGGNGAAESKEWICEAVSWWFQKMAEFELFTYTREAWRNLISQSQYKRVFMERVKSYEFLINRIPTFRLVNNNFLTVASLSFGTTPSKFHGILNITFTGNMLTQSETRFLFNLWALHFTWALTITFLSFVNQTEYEICRENFLHKQIFSCFFRAEAFTGLFIKCNFLLNEFLSLKQNYMELNYC